MWNHGSPAVQVQGTLTLARFFFQVSVFLFRAASYVLTFILLLWGLGVINLQHVNSEKRTQNTKVLGRAEVPMTYKATRGSSCWPGICPDSNPHVLVFNYEKRGTVTFGSATGAGEAGEDTSS